MKRFASMMVFLVSGLVGSRAFAHPVGEKFQAVLTCTKGSQDALRHFCAVRSAAHSAWSKGEKFTPPGVLTSYVGLGMFVPNGEDNVRKLILDNTHLVALHMDPTHAKIQTLTASKDNEQEKQELAVVIIQIAAALKQRSITRVSVSKDLDTYFRRERQKTLYSLATGGGTGVLTDAKIGTTFEEVSLNNGLHVYVAYEMATNGVYVSLFPKLPLTQQSMQK